MLQVYAVDESPEAVAWAKLNVQRLGLTDRIQVSITTAHPTHKPGDAQAGLAHKASGSSDNCRLFWLICIMLLYLALQGNAFSIGTRSFAQSIDH